MVVSMGGGEVKCLPCANVAKLLLSKKSDNLQQMSPRRTPAAAAAAAAATCQCGQCHSRTKRCRCCATSERLASSLTTNLATDLVGGGCRTTHTPTLFNASSKSFKASGQQQCAQPEPTPTRGPLSIIDNKLAVCSTTRVRTVGSGGRSASASATSAKVSFKLSRLVTVSLTAHLPLQLLLLVLALALLQLVPSSSYIGQVNALAIGSAARTIDTNYIGDNCASEANLKLAQTSKAAEMLLLLKCDIEPLYKQFTATYYDGKEPTSIGGQALIASELNSLKQALGTFVEVGMEVVSNREWCISSTFDQLASLKTLSASNGLLALIYDLIAIELHTTCIGQSMSKMPKVPHIISEIIKIYINGPDKPVIDLNSVPLPDSSDESGEILFNAERAIARYGKIDQVADLLLQIGITPVSSSNIADQFKRECKDFVQSIQLPWNPMDTMSKELTTEGNSIKEVNNYVQHTLKAIKFADICSKLSSYKCPSC